MLSVKQLRGQSDRDCRTLSFGRRTITIEHSVGHKPYQIVMKTVRNGTTRHENKQCGCQKGWCPERWRSGSTVKSRAFRIGKKGGPNSKTPHKIGTQIVLGPRPCSRWHLDCFHAGISP